MQPQPKPTIDRFVAKYQFLSNFYYAPVKYQGDTYKSAEHAYQAHKCKYDSDRLRVRDAPTAFGAKRLGRIHTMREDWDTLKLNVMQEIVFAKFVQNPELRNKLLKTGDLEIIEGNTWGDVYWGVCAGKGENHLGKILMEVRRRLRQYVTLK